MINWDETKQEQLEKLEALKCNLKVHNSYFVTYFWGRFFIWPLCRLFIIKGIKPNTITIFMIISGILGSILLCVPNLIFTIIGAGVIQFFQIFDDCDGRVARCTKTYSKYGLELDYLAHIVCHPLMDLAFATVIYRIMKIDAAFLTLLTATHAVVEMATRGLLGLSQVEKVKDKSVDNQETIQPYSFGWFSRYILSFFTVFPIYAMIMPIFLVIDWIFGLEISFLYMLSSTLISLLMLFRSYFQTALKYYWS